MWVKSIQANSIIASCHKVTDFTLQSFLAYIPCALWCAALLEKWGVCTKKDMECIKRGLCILWQQKDKVRKLEIRMIHLPRLGHLLCCSLGVEQWEVLWMMSRSGILNWILFFLFFLLFQKKMSSLLPRSVWFMESPCTEDFLEKFLIHFLYVNEVFIIT